MPLSLSIKVFSILKKYIQILCYPYLQIIYKKNLDFTIRISENIKRILVQMPCLYQNDSLQYYVTFCDIQLLSSIVLNFP